jgi:hypothetical protein
MFVNTLHDVCRHSQQLCSTKLFCILLLNKPMVLLNSVAVTHLLGVHDPNRQQATDEPMVLLNSLAVTHLLGVHDRNRQQATDEPMVLLNSVAVTHLLGVHDRTRQQATDEHTPQQYAPLYATG